MDDVSNRLRRARERAGLRIEDISACTRIKPAFLVALETGHFETLPGHFFARAFLKSYAREVGLAPDEVAREFDLVHTSPPVELEKISAAVDAQPKHPYFDRPYSDRPYSFQLSKNSWQFAAVVGVVLIVLSLIDSPQTNIDSAPAAVGTSGQAAAPVAAPSEPPAPEMLTMQIRPRGVIWVSATADGATAIYKLLQPGQSVSVEGRELTFRIGNAAAFEYLHQRRSRKNPRRGRRSPRVQNHTRQLPNVPSLTVVRCPLSVDRSSMRARTACLLRAPPQGV